VSRRQDDVHGRCEAHARQARAASSEAAGTDPCDRPEAESAAEFPASAEENSAIPVRRPRKRAVFAGISGEQFAQGSARMGINMENLHSVQTCRWGGLTLFLPYPLWLTSEACEWSCLRDLPPRPIVSTDACRTCQLWERRTEQTAEGEIARGIAVR
jgi:hypothetical protein